MNSGQFQAQFSPHERSILGNTLALETYHPTPRSGLNHGLQSGTTLQAAEKVIFMDRERVGTGFSPYINPTRSFGL
jgi:hypothetical protein